MKELKKILLVVAVSIAILCFVNTAVYSQMSFVEHDIGKMTFSYRPTSPLYSLSDCYYPNGEYRNQMSYYHQPMVVVRNMVATEGAAPVEATTYSWSRWHRELNMVRKYTPPKIVVDGLSTVPPFTGEIDPDLDADSYWYTRQDFGNTGNTGPSAKLWLRSRAYANQFHDDYILWERYYESDLDGNADGVEDRPDVPLDVVVGHMPCFSPTQRARALGYHNMNPSTNVRANESWRWAEKIPVTLATGATRSELTVSFAHDADLVRTDYPPTWDEPGIQGDFNDEYDPIGPETGALTTENCEFISPYWCGWATLYADKSQHDHTDDITMPKTTGKLSLKYDFWGGQFSKGTRYDRLTNGETEKREDEMGYEDPTYWGGTEIGYQYQMWGPYLGMKNGDYINTVFVTAMGNVDEDYGRTKAVEYMKWYRDGEGSFDDAAKQSLLDSGKDSLTAHINRAYWNYNDKNYDIPDPLGAPDIEVTSGPDAVYVGWSYSNADMYKDPDTGVEDFSEWKLYRKVGKAQVNHFDDLGYKKYELIGTFPKETTTFTDNNVVRGLSYHYCVTAVDDGSQYNTVGGVFNTPQQLESSFYQNRTQADVVPFLPGENTTDNVLIVPNPYSLSTGSENEMNFPGHTNDIHFVNLPSYCTLKIYTATGDLIQTLEHTSGSADEIWTNMRTASNQAPVSGVYILVVDKARDLNNLPLPKKFFKFVIVR